MRGGDKLTERIDGVPLLRRQALAALEAASGVESEAASGSAPGTIVVTLPPLPHPREEAVADLPLTRVALDDPARGMSASIRAGLEALPEDAAAVMILPADMPEITANDLRLILSAHAAEPEAIHRATGADGTPGHPVIFPADLRPALARLDGDTGARDVLKANAHRLRLHPLPGRHALTDLDTPEAWAAWRATRPES